MDIVRTVADLRARVKGWRDERATVGLVPTMGALHEGHLALVRAALGERDRAVATIFVNPAQFGLNEDLVRYPRQEASDAAMLDGLGCNLLFAPSVEEMYPDGFATTVTVSKLADRLCGLARPHHFAGVTTIVSKLLLQALPDRAYFGEKDFQQLQLIKRMARDLDIPVEIRGVPTVRDDSGLALSSRNKYLGDDGLAVAAKLNRILRESAERLCRGESQPTVEAASGLDALRAAGFDKVDYFEICDAETLEPVTSIERPARVLAAVHVGATRLIDNMAVAPAESAGRKTQ